MIRYNKEGMLKQFLYEYIKETIEKQIFNPEIEKDYFGNRSLITNTILLYRRNVLDKIDIENLYSYINLKLTNFIEESFFDISRSNDIFLSDDNAGYVIRYGDEFYEFDTLEGVKKSLTKEGIVRVFWEGAGEAPIIGGIDVSETEPIDEEMSYWIIDVFLKVVYDRIKSKDTFLATLLGTDYDFDSDDGAAKFLLANKVIIGDENVEN